MRLDHFHVTWVGLGLEGGENVLNKCFGNSMPNFFFQTKIFILLRKNYWKSVNEKRFSCSDNKE